METLRTLHDITAWCMVLANAGAGSWALAAVRWPRFRTRWLWRLTLVAELIVFVQAGLGVGLAAGYDLEPAEFHMFYGFVAIITVGIIYSYRQQMEHRLHLLYGFGGLFIMGLGIRAMFLGS